MVMERKSKGLKAQTVRSFLDRGVVIVDPASTFIEKHVEIEKGTMVYPFTYVCKNVVIGQRCRIGPFAYLEPGAMIEDGAYVRNMMEKGKAFFCKR